MQDKAIPKAEILTQAHQKAADMKNCKNSLSLTKISFFCKYGVVEECCVNKLYYNVHINFSENLNWSHVRLIAGNPESLTTLLNLSFIDYKIHSYNNTSRYTERF